MSQRQQKEAEILLKKKGFLHPTAIMSRVGPVTSQMLSPLAMASYQQPSYSGSLISPFTSQRNSMMTGAVQQQTLQDKQTSGEMSNSIFNSNQEQSDKVNAEHVQVVDDKLCQSVSQTLLETRNSQHGDISVDAEKSYDESRDKVHDLASCSSSNQGSRKSSVDFTEGVSGHVPQHVLLQQMSRQVVNPALQQLRPSQPGLQMPTFMPPHVFSAPGMPLYNTNMKPILSHFTGSLPQQFPGQAFPDASFMQGYTAGMGMPLQQEQSHSQSSLPFSSSMPQFTQTTPTVPQTMQQPGQPANIEVAHQTSVSDAELSTNQVNAETSQPTTPGHFETTHQLQHQTHVDTTQLPTYPAHFSQSQPAYLDAHQLPHPVYFAMMQQPMQQAYIGTMQQVKPQLNLGLAQQPSQMTLNEATQPPIQSAHIETAQSSTHLAYTDRTSIGTHSDNIQPTQLVLSDKTEDLLMPSHIDHTHRPISPGHVDTMQHSYPTHPPIAYAPVHPVYIGTTQQAAQSLPSDVIEDTSAQTTHQQNAPQHTAQLPQVVHGSTTNIYTKANPSDTAYQPVLPAQYAIHQQSGHSHSGDKMQQLTMPVDGDTVLQKSSELAPNVGTQQVTNPVHTPVTATSQVGYNDAVQKPIHSTIKKAMQPDN